MRDDPAPRLAAQQTPRWGPHRPAPRLVRDDSLPPSRLPASRPLRVLAALGLVLGGILSGYGAHAIMRDAPLYCAAQLERNTPIGFACAIIGLP